MCRNAPCIRRARPVLARLGVPLVEAELIVKDQAWATPQEDGRHYGMLIPVEVRRRRIKWHMLKKTKSNDHLLLSRNSKHKRRSRIMDESESAAKAKQVGTYIWYRSFEYSVVCSCRGAAGGIIKNAS